MPDPPAASGLADAIARHVPRLVRDHLGTAGRRRETGEADTIAAAVLWLDIEGFTPLTRRFADQGARGAEIVAGILNRCFDAVIERIAGSGGDVIDFAGDAVLALWPAAGADGLTEAVTRATHCAVAIQSAMDRYPAGDEAVLRFYATVGAGTVSLLDAGGEGGRWAFVVAGSPLDQIARGREARAAGQVVVSGDALALVRQRFPFEAGPHGFATLVPGGASGVDTGTVAVAPPEPPVPASDEPLLRSYLADPVARRLAAGQTEWMAEFRQASVVFAGLPTAEADTSAGRAAIRDATRVAQDAARRLGGLLNQVMVDDTGLVLIVAWGVPDHTHEDDARRAVQAAIDIDRDLRARGLAPRLGIATGRVFSGSLGNDRRRQYTLVGAAVNRAARLATSSAAGVVCDEPTGDRAGRWFHFAPPELLTLKGLPEPVRAFRPEGAKRGQPAMPAMPAAVRGRDRERQVLSDALARAARGEASPPVIVEGEPGIGKSVLLQHVVREAEAAGHRALTGAADAVERNTPYYPWREVYRQLFALEPDGDETAQRARVRELLVPVAGAEERVPLLDAVLSLGFADNEVTAAMAGADRGRATRELLADVLLALGGPLPVVVLDDLHWFDSASLELLGAIRERVPRALVVAATRTTDDEALPQLAALTAAVGVTRITLGEMDREDVMGMVRNSLGVAELPDALGSFLMERGEGHPLFTMELALLLREAGVVRVVDGRCAFDPDDERLAALTVSDTAEGIVATRLDRLEPAHQLTLKVASVIGRTFEYRLVRDVYPIETGRAAVRAMLDDLTRPRLIEPHRPEPALAYLFRHVVIREVAYGLVAYAQRRRLHEEVARALEAADEADQAANYPLLAHHWRMAEAHGPAIDYLERAGVEALHRGAGPEAFRFFQDAFALAERERATVAGITDVRLAELERLSGEAVEQMLDVPKSSQWLERALARLGYRAPGIGDRARRRQIVRQVARQVGHIAWPQALRPRPAPDQAASLELAARAYGTLAEHCYFESDLEGMLLFSLTSVNLAERARRPAAAERSYVTLAHSAGLAGLTSLANRYRRRSAQTTLGRNRAFREIELAGRLLARGEMAEAAAGGERAAGLARRYADRHHEAQGWGLVVSALLRLGWPDRAAEAAGRIIPTGRLDWALAGQCGACLLAGRPAGALERYAAIATWEPAFAIAHLVAQVLWAEESGDMPRARQRALDVLAALEGPGLKNALTIGHYGNLLSFYSRAYHDPTADGGAREAVAGEVRRLHAELTRQSRVFRIGRPRRDHAAALLDLHAGRTARGTRRLASGLALADRLGMQPDVVALLVEQARWQLPGGAEALARARRLCVERRMDRLLAQVEAAAASLRWPAS